MNTAQKIGSENFRAQHNALFENFKAELISKFTTKDFQNIPCLFTPFAGKKYAQSQLRIAFIGKETLYWGKEGKSLSDQLKEDYQSCIPTDFFHKHEFLNYKNKNGKKGRMTLGTFWGFVLKMLSEIYGIPDWKTLRKNPSAYSDILNSFLWANVHALETPDSRAIKALKGKKKIKNEAYELARSASDRFNSFNLIQKHFAPNVVVLADKSHTEKEYILKHFFQNVRLTRVRETRDDIPSLGTIDIYKVEDSKTYIFHIWHPSYTFRKGHNRLIEEYTRKINDCIKKTFPRYKLTTNHHG